MTTTTEKTVEEEIAEWKARVADYEANHKDELFLGFDTVVCADVGCAGATLFADIIMNPNINAHYGLRGEMFTRLSNRARQDMRDAFAPNIETCECGKVLI